MKSITFRPLRLNKKTGKIMVASYSQWRQVKIYDYNKFNLTINNEYKDMHKDDYVHDHEGNLLYWYPYHNPNEFPATFYSYNEQEIRPEDAGRWVRVHDSGRWYCCVSGFDCEAVPVFSHYTADYIATNLKETFDIFEPLTVGMVVKWFGWFLLQLENSYLKIGK